MTQLPNGSVLLNMRHQSAPHTGRAVAISHDGGACVQRHHALVSFLCFVALRHDVWADFIRQSFDQSGKETSTLTFEGVSAPARTHVGGCVWCRSVRLRSPLSEATRISATRPAPQVHCRNFLTSWRLTCKPIRAALDHHPAQRRQCRDVAGLVAGGARSQRRCVGRLLAGARRRSHAHRPFACCASGYSCLVAGELRKVRPRAGILF